MMKVLTFPLGQLQANCYLLIKDNACVVIDPGDSADFILETILRKNLTLQGILATHGHFDHVMAVGEIQLNYPVPFYIHKKDLFLIERLQSTAEHFLEHKPVVIPPREIKFIQEGILGALNFEFRILYTPGHTPGSCCFYFEKDKALFTGDTVFKGEIGRAEFNYGKPLELRKSVNKIFSLDDDTVIYPGHGEETLLQPERERLTTTQE